MTSRSNARIAGMVLLALGLLGHLLAAQASGGSFTAYWHHIAGFLGLALVTGAIIAGLQWLFWRGRHGVTVLIIGAVQAVLGLIVYAST